MLIDRETSPACHVSIATPNNDDDDAKMIHYWHEEWEHAPLEDGDEKAQDMRCEHRSSCLHSLSPALHKHAYAISFIIIIIIIILLLDISFFFYLFIGSSVFFLNVPFVIRKRTSNSPYLSSTQTCNSRLVIDEKTYDNKIEIRKRS